MPLSGASFSGEQQEDLCFTSAPKTQTAAIAFHLNDGKSTAPNHSQPPSRFPPITAPRGIKGKSPNEEPTTHRGPSTGAVGMGAWGLLATSLLATHEIEQAPPVARRSPRPRPPLAKAPGRIAGPPQRPALKPPCAPRCPPATILWFSVSRALSTPAMPALGPPRGLQRLSLQ